MHVDSYGQNVDENYMFTHVHGSVLNQISSVLESADHTGKVVDQEHMQHTS